MCGYRALRTTDERQDKALAEAIRAIGKDQFPALLSNFLRQCAEFDNIIIIRYKDQHVPTVLYREYKDQIVYGAMDSEYITGNFVLDPFYEAHIKGLESGIFRLFDLAPDRFRQTSYFKIYYEKTTLVDEIAAFVKMDSGVTITACMGTDRTSGRMFTKAQFAALNRHVAVITSLIDMNWKQFQLPSVSAAVTDKPVAERLRDQLAIIKGIKLSTRQAEVALLILQGHSSGSIALMLDISANTVKVFRKQLYAKCRLSSQAELFAMIVPLLFSSRTDIPKN
jgi:DNA-binding CsgD family transcriptional regulator